MLERNAGQRVRGAGGRSSVRAASGRRVGDSSRDEGGGDRVHSRRFQPWRLPHFAHDLVQAATPKSQPRLSCAVLPSRRLGARDAPLAAGRCSSLPSCAPRSLESARRSSGASAKPALKKWPQRPGVSKKFLRLRRPRKRGGGPEASRAAGACPAHKAAAVTRKGTTRRTPLAQQRGRTQARGQQAPSANTADIAKP